jgi:hypothetical protein
MIAALLPYIPSKDGANEDGEAESGSEDSGSDFEGSEGDEHEGVTTMTRKMKTKTIISKKTLILTVIMR